jgi:hypothetical protein
MKTKTEKILTILHILAWIVFIGFSIDAGAMIVSFIVSIVNPTAAANLFKEIDLQQLRQYDLVQYVISVGLMIFYLVLKAQVAYMLIQVLSKIKMSNPFVIETSKALEKISYMILTAWIMALIHNLHAGVMMKRVADLDINLLPSEFIFYAGVVYVISQIFKKGVEIQSENELTI